VIKYVNYYLCTGRVDVNDQPHFRQLDFTLKRQVFLSVRAVEESLAFSLRLPQSLSEKITGLLGKHLFDDNLYLFNVFMFYAF